MNSHCAFVIRWVRIIRIVILCVGIRWADIMRVVILFFVIMPVVAALRVMLNRHFVCLTQSRILMTQRRRWVGRSSADAKIASRGNARGGEKIFISAFKSAQNVNNSIRFRDGRVKTFLDPPCHIYACRLCPHPSRVAVQFATPPEFNFWTFGNDRSLLSLVVYYKLLLNRQISPIFCCHLSCFLWQDSGG